MRDENSDFPECALGINIIEDAGWVTYLEQVTIGLTYVYVLYAYIYIGSFVIRYGSIAFRYGPPLSCNSLPMFYLIFSRKHPKPKLLRSKKRNYTEGKQSKWKRCRKIKLFRTGNGYGGWCGTSTRYPVKAKSCWLADIFHLLPAIFPFKNPINWTLSRPPMIVTVCGFGIQGR